MAAKRRSRHGAGLGMDVAGGNGIDPSENVKALSEALSQRQDDLRDLNNKYLDARLDAAKEMAILRADHSQEIRKLDSDRLEKIRMVDVSNTAITAAQQLAAIQTLAATATANADTLRAMVATTATTIQNQTDRIVGAITERLAVLEKTSYTGQGKQALADPQMVELMSEMKKLSTAGAVVTGKSEGLSLGAALLLGIVTLISGLLGIGSILYAVLKP